MKFECTDVYNIEGALRGLRNPKDSHHLSDSGYSFEKGKFIIGEKDLDLCQRMIIGGSTHAKFMRQILISVDITAPRYWWSEWDTYKIGTVANSCSTMHKLTDYPITNDMFSNDDVILTDEDEELKTEINDWWEYTIKLLEKIRLKGKKTKKFKYKRIMKQMLPESFLQKRTITLNYEVIRHMISSRSHHQLVEWNTDFIEWAKTLPYSEELLFFNIKYQ